MVSENRRKYYRARIVLPASWDVLSDEQAALAKQGMGSSLLGKSICPSPIDEFLSQTTPGSKEERLYRCIQLLNNKLDFLIERALAGPGDERGGLDDVIEISGSGLKFLTQESLSQGDIIRMNIMIPETSLYRMEFLAEVLRVEEQDAAHLVAARIVAIDEDARDAIVQTVFRKQRQSIRQEKETTPGEST
ncbi:MAG: PilZ domain-containing protein [Desulfobacteraceae bacterium]|jgi:hypothetical protein